MPLVDIYLSGRKYTISCEAGHEPRLRELAEHVGGRLRELSEGDITGSDAHMLVLACLLITDQLFETTEAGDRPRVLTPPPAAKDADRAAAAAAVEAAARRIKDLAARLERA